MRKWLIAATFALASIGAALGYIHLSEARSQEARELLAMMPGAREIDIRRMTAEPSLLALESPRVWIFSTNEKQADALQDLCKKTRSTFPSNNIRAIDGCIASYYFDAMKYRYVTLALKSGTAILTSANMSRSDFNELLNGYNDTLPAFR